MQSMYTYKELTLVTDNSSWWKRIKYRKESANFLYRQKCLGWRFIRKESIEKDPSCKDTRTFYKYFLRKKAE